MHKQISYAERYALYICLKDNLSYREITKKLGRSPNSWNYEVINNGEDRESYNPDVAHFNAQLRKWNANSRNPMKNKRVWDYVLQKLNKGYSPEQIAGRIKDDHKKDKTMRISHETIYIFINSYEGRDLELAKCLRRKKFRKLRKGRLKALPPKKTKIPNRISINKRPKIVENKKRFGDWESDLMEGRRGTKAAL